MDITNKKFGRLTPLRFSHYNKYKNPFWLCKCDCGKIISVRESSLRSGLTKSCGCLQKEVSTKHGMRNHRLYRIYHGMLERCYNKNCIAYKNYGERNIFVCDEWLSDFKSFYDWSMANGYKEGLSIDRIDVNKGYSPKNCRWADNKIQGRNKRNNHILEYQGEKYILSELCEIYKLIPQNVLTRLKKGWSVEDAINVPFKKYKKEFKE